MLLIYFFSYVIHVIPLQGASQLIVSQAIGIFWILFLDLLVHSGESYKYFLLRSLGILLLGFSHESIIFLLLTLSCTYFLKSRQKGWSKTHLVLGLSSLAVVGRIVFKVFARAGAPAGFFWSSLRQWSPQRYYCLFLSVFLLILILQKLDFKNLKVKLSLKFILASLCLVGLFLPHVFFSSIWQSSDARSTAVFFLTPWALAVVYQTFISKQSLKNFSSSPEILGILILSILFIGTQDFIYSSNWRKSVRYFKRDLAQLPVGCGFSPKSYGLLSTDLLSLYSIVYKPPQQQFKILFSSKVEENACDELINRNKIMLGGWYVSLQNPEIISEIQKIPILGPQSFRK